MKAYPLFILFLIISPVLAQNLQLHYADGPDNPYVMSTLEMFKPTPKGAWFWFVDIDYNSERKSASTAYWEIIRYCNLPLLDGKWQWKIEYNDGLTIGGSGEDIWGLPLGSAWLTGFGYPVNLGAITLQTDLAFRYMDISRRPDWQLTLSWFESWFNDKLVCTGYVDFWSQDQEGVKKWMVFFEPQFWVMFNEVLGLGGELRITRNFLPQYGDVWKVFPTIGVKCIF